MSLRGKPTAKTLPPKILLIGTGYFGKNHLRVLKELDAKKIIILAGVIVRNKRKGLEIQKEHSVKIYSEITPSLLKSVDAIDIVTPPETHFDIVKKCLPYTNVFVEKPLTVDVKESEKLEKLAEKYNRVLAVGHIFRYHAVSEKIKILLEKRGLPKKIRGHFLNPVSSDTGREPSFELMHLFDIVHYIWKKDPEIISSRKHERVSHVDIRYANNSDAHFMLGWTGDERVRTLTFKYPNYSIEADFAKNTFIEKKNNVEKIHTLSQEDNITKELIHFIEIIKTGKGTPRADASVGKKMVEISHKAIPKSKKLPTVAVIGGGIFGTSIASELASFSKVTIFERHDKLMQEGTYATCFRHHGGYHYPRSSETVLDIQTSRDEFEAVYKNAILETFPTYYGIAKHNSHINAKEFLEFCKKHNLIYKESSLPNEVLVNDKIALCVEVKEHGYHYEALTKIIEKRILKNKNIKVLYGSPATKLSLNSNGTKTLYYKNKKTLTNQKEFDFVINATYANINHIMNSAYFEQFPIRIDLAEVVVVKIDHPPISITIIDGPFVTLIPTGNKHEFILYHVTESILDRYVPKDGTTKKTNKVKSNAEVILNESKKFLPILNNATILESRIVNRGVRAYREHDDNRVADIIEHGFGCWSVLSGKMLSSVKIGKKIAKIVQKTTKK